MKRLLLLAPLPALANEAGLCPPGATELQLEARAEGLRQTLGRPRVELRRLQLSPQGGVAPRPMARAMLMEAASAPPLEVEGGESTIAVQAGGIACVLP